MKAAVISIVGRPSAGKSTLLNRICGEKISIVSPSPQTTRNTIRGILTDPRGQLIFVDTPGFHLSDKKINLRMRSLVMESLKEIDAVLYVVDTTRPPGEEEAAIARVLAADPTLVVVALNKADLPPFSGEGQRALLSKLFPGTPFYEISAMTGSGVPELVDRLFDQAPEGDQMYPEEFFTDQDPEFRISEIIREKAIERVRQEVPHSLYVEIADMELPSDDGRPRAHSVEASANSDGGTPADLEGDLDGRHEQRLWIRAFVVIERESQKRILIGRGGSMIKEIRVAAQREIEAVFPYHVYLDLRVKVNPKWRKSEPTLKRLIN